eukprot:2235839-Rhodomonas_salina.2
MWHGPVLRSGMVLCACTATRGGGLGTRIGTGLGTLSGTGLGTLSGTCLGTRSGTDPGTRRYIPHTFIHHEKRGRMFWGDDKKEDAKKLPGVNVDESPLLDAAGAPLHEMGQAIDNPFPR